MLRRFFRPRKRFRVDDEERRAGDDAVRPGLVKLGNRARVPKVLVEESGAICYANAAAAALVGVDRHAVERVDVFSFVHPDDEARARADLHAFVAGRITKPAPEYVVRRGDGAWAYLSIEAMNLLDVPAAAGILLTARDVTAARAHEQTLLDLALRDPVTDVGNRRALTRHLARILTTAQPLAVMFFDLDFFRRVNESLGHTAGDAVLHLTAARLAAHASATAVVHRFGADTFVVTLSEAGAPRAVEIAWALLADLSAPMFVAGSELRLTATAGLAAREAGTTPVSILRDADAALTRAKLSRRGGVELFSESMRADVLRRFEMETDLRRALEHDELSVHLQPVVRFATGKEVASEALVRWERAGASVEPELFVRVAEETGLVVALGDWVLRRALSILESDGATRISVNLSPRQLFDPRLPSHVERALDSRGVRADRLAFEITETAAVENYELAARCFESLRSLGCAIGLDDFGSGYSSLAYLRHLPLDFLKIDRSLVTDVDADSQAIRIVQAIVALADALGLSTVAEGIERQTQLEALVDVGVQLGQGWLLGRPAPPRAR